MLLLRLLLLPLLLRLRLRRLPLILHISLLLLLLFLRLATDCVLPCPPYLQAMEQLGEPVLKPFLQVLGNR